MKKLLAIVLIIFTATMGYVFVGGFLQKQSKDNTKTTSTTNTAISTDTTATTAPVTPTGTNKTYSASEIAKHNSDGDCWLIINNNVYSVGSFMDRHPGGAELILPYCGQEATQAFDTKGHGGRGSMSGHGHSNQANQLLNDYLIGTLQTNP